MVRSLKNSVNSYGIVNCIQLSAFCRQCRTFAIYDFSQQECLLLRKMAEPWRHKQRAFALSIVSISVGYTLLFAHPGVSFFNSDVRGEAMIEYRGMKAR